MIYLIALALALHLIAATLWVGGMFLLHMCLRPNLGALEPPARLTLMRGTLGKFFPWVWAVIATLVGSGYLMLFAVYGGFAGAGMHIHLMNGLAFVMILLFAHLFFAPWKRMRRAVDGQDWAAAGRNLGQIRTIVTINLTLGLAVIAISGGGRYLA
ncbi:CopD family protein [Marivibrio halodurans]|uniref:CopD family protein n=1 Tax=Marivibrio halodurans TaxID=2039722 RepID=A0A8J7S032_9PROT|nr:CopD family protein [Marivibrio halodurans]MBP5856213.1 CopD family protein [Marivibrio halodurans]